MKGRLLVALVLVGLLLAGLWWGLRVPDGRELPAQRSGAVASVTEDDEDEDTGAEDEPPLSSRVRPAESRPARPSASEDPLASTAFCMVKGGDVAEVHGRVFTAASPALGLPVTVENEGYLLRFKAPREAEMVELRGRMGDGRELYALAELVWVGERARCRGIIEPDANRHVVLSGRVTGLLEGERGFVQSCLGYAEVRGPDGLFLQEGMAEEGTCRVRAFRQDGALQAQSEVLRLPIEGDEEYEEMVLALPEVDIGGIGARVEAVEQGVRLASLMDGAPAAEAGIRNGEVLTAVDGEPLAGLELEEAIAKITGPEGSEAEYTVLDEDGGVRTVRVRRQRIE